MEKSKTIDPSKFANLSVYSCVIPILIFLFRTHNWKERLKWFCFLLILLNLLADQASNYFSKLPIASGTIVSTTSTIDKHSLNVQLTNGSLHQGEFLKSPTFSGTISKVVQNETQIAIEIDTKQTINKLPTKFEVFSTVKLFNISSIINIVLTFLIFSAIFSQNQNWKKLSLLALAVTIVVWVYRNLILDEIYSFSSFFNGFTTILIIIFALAFYYFQLVKPDIPFIYASASFWIVTSILLYRAGTFFLFLYVNTLDQTEKSNFFLINSIFYDIQNILFAVAFFIKAKPAQTKTSKIRIR